MTDVSGNTTPGDDGNPNLARAKNAGLFPRTRWSLVRGAAIVHTALGDWLGSYWYPLYAWARKRGASPEDAADGVQGFFEYLLSGELLRKARPGEGRFRNFLLVAFRRWLGDP